jgi:hypothetical protein
MKVTSDFEITDLTLKEGKTIGKIGFTIPDYPVVPTTPPVVEPPPVVVDPPVITFPPGTGITSGFQDALNSAGDGKEVIIAKGTFLNVPNLTLKPNVSLIGFEKGGVIIKPASKKLYVAGTDNSDAWLRAASPSRVAGNQKIANLKILGEGAQGGVFIENRDNVSVDNVEIGLCSFMGFWARYCKGLRVNGMILYDNSWCTTGAGGWASGEFCYCELDDFIINDVYVSSTAKSRGYGFKALWGSDLPKGVHRNIYSGKFTKLRTNMHHESNWNNGASHNIGFELHGLHVKGNVSIEDSIIENQVSLHQPDATNSTGSFKYLRNQHNGENDRYAIELIMNNVEIANNSIINCSQFTFNGQDNMVVKNGNIHHNSFDQGTAPDVSWGATFMFGAKGADNIQIHDNPLIRRKSTMSLLKFQGTSPVRNVNIDASNVLKTF